MRGRIPDKVRVQHILECIEGIEKAINNKSFEDFLNDDLFRKGIERYLEIIGEAANHITEDTKDKYENINWYRMKGLRNIIIHEYFGIDNAIIWEVATYFLKIEKIKIEKLFYELY